jgi:hypothetical protein
VSIVQHDSSNERLDALAGALREGRLSEAEAAELQALLQAQPGARRRFVEHMMLTAALESECELVATRHADVGWWERNQERLSRWRWFAAGMALAVSLLLPLTLLFTRHGEPAAEPAAEFVDRGVAVLVEAIDARWADSHTPIRVGASLPRGRMKLLQGLARIDFYSGASVVLQGQADLELISPMESILHGGSLRANVPAHAEGFVVRSRELKLVDRGTSFGIRVDDAAGTEVHVFEGRVELRDLGPRGADPSLRELTSGAAVRVARDGSAASVAADAEGFTGWGELERRSAASLEQRFERWRHFRDTLLKDPRLVAYYPFDRDPQHARRLENRSPNRQRALVGSLVGCNWSQGRWPGKDALEFKRPSDRVRIDVPGSYASLTLCAWVRPDGLDNPFNSLLLSDGWTRPGAVHWQVTRRAEVELSVWRSANTNPNTGKFQLFDAYDLGRWVHLAVVYDGQARRVTHYRNGEPIGTSRLEGAVPLSIGPAEIGNWNTLTFPDGAPIRNFNGRIDELAIFSTALDAAELRRAAQSGSP